MPYRTGGDGFAMVMLIFFVIMVLVGDSTRYVGIDTNIILIFYPRNK